jgi:hypothetical protein
LTTRRAAGSQTCRHGTSDHESAEHHASSRSRRSPCTTP